MSTMYKRDSQTNVERTTDEEILMGASRARRLVEESGYIHEVLEVLFVDDDWESGDPDIRQFRPFGPSIRSDSRKQLDSG